MSTEKLFTVWVGGIEVNDCLLSETDAKNLAELWRGNGYDDVIIEEVDK